ncbi:hypothetical protein BTUL_0190g00050 [Botrytis tulipae]|uniref:Uncharacterized protein n=1 Tax=Botrytis tulipae TaxID=87230 RepID=A0A4Z1ECB0_9HELO|nr:hypothetical protein BTUL_0190g00050 [Botrytis tulipae]
MNGVEQKNEVEEVYEENERNGVSKEHVILGRLTGIFPALQGMFGLSTAEHLRSQSGLIWFTYRSASRTSMPIVNLISYSKRQKFFPTDNIISFLVWQAPDLEAETGPGQDPRLHACR